jgi:GDPmannose 4,6-dehydratase
VSRKITIAVSKIKKGLQDKLLLGNLDARRDWGYAPDYVDGMWRMLQQDKPQDFVLATNETHTVREFVQKAFAYLKMQIEFKGKGLDEVGLVGGKIVVAVDPKYFRPSEVDLLLGNASKAKRMLGWEPTIKFDDLVQIMVDHDHAQGG